MIGGRAPARAISYRFYIQPDAAFGNCYALPKMPPDISAAPPPARSMRHTFRFCSKILMMIATPFQADSFRGLSASITGAHRRAACDADAHELYAG